MMLNTRLWAIICGVAAVAILAGGWFLGVQPQLAQAQSTDASTAQLTAQNQAATIRLASLTKAAAKLDSMKAQEAVLQKAVPEVLKPNTFIRRINEVAALDGVQVVSVIPSDATAYAAPPSATGTAAPSATGGSAPPVLAATNALITGANFATVPVTVGVTGPQDVVMQFTHDIQNDERMFAITGLQTSTKEGSSSISASLTGYIYTLQR